MNNFHKLTLAIKSLQVEWCLNSNTSFKNDNPSVQDLLICLDEVFGNGMRGQSRCYWTAVKQFTPTYLVKQIQMMQQLDTENSKGYAWLHLILNEKLLEPILSSIEQNDFLVQTFYDRSSCLRTSEIQLAQEILHGLEYISFDLEVNATSLASFNHRLLKFSRVCSSPSKYKDNEVGSTVYLDPTFLTKHGKKVVQSISKVLKKTDTVKKQQQIPMTDFKPLQLHGKASTSLLPDLIDFKGDTFTPVNEQKCLSSSETFTFCQDPWDCVLLKSNHSNDDDLTGQDLNPHVTDTPIEVIHQRRSRSHRKASNRTECQKDASVLCRSIEKPVSCFAQSKDVLNRRSTSSSVTSVDFNAKQKPFMCNSISHTRFSTCKCGLSNDFDMSCLKDVSKDLLSPAKNKFLLHDQYAAVLAKKSSSSSNNFGKPSHSYSETNPTDVCFADCHHNKALAVDDSYNKSPNGVILFLGDKCNAASCHCISIDSPESFNENEAMVDLYAIGKSDDVSCHQVPDDILSHDGIKSCCQLCDTGKVQCSYESSTKSISIALDPSFSKQHQAHMADELVLSLPKSSIENSAAIISDSSSKHCSPNPPNASFKEYSPIDSHSSLTKSFAVIPDTLLKECHPITADTSLKKCHPITHDPSLKECHPITPDTALKECHPSTPDTLLKECHPITPDTLLKECHPIIPDTALKECHQITPDISLKECHPITPDTLLKECYPIIPDTLLKECHPIIPDTSLKKCYSINPDTLSKESHPITSDTLFKECHPIIPDTALKERYIITSETSLKEYYPIIPDTALKERYIITSETSLKEYYPIIPDTSLKECHPISPETSLKECHPITPETSLKECHPITPQPSLEECHPITPGELLKEDCHPNTPDASVKEKCYPNIPDASLIEECHPNISDTLLKECCSNYSYSSLKQCHPIIYEQSLKESSIPITLEPSSTENSPLTSCSLLKECFTSDLVLKESSSNSTLLSSTESFPIVPGVQVAKDNSEISKTLASDSYYIVSDMSLREDTAINLDQLEFEVFRRFELPLSNNLVLKFMLDILKSEDEKILKLIDVAFENVSLLFSDVAMYIVRKVDGSFTSMFSLPLLTSSASPMLDDQGVVFWEGDSPIQCCYTLNGDLTQFILASFNTINGKREESQTKHKIWLQNMVVGLVGSVHNDITACYVAKWQRKDAGTCAGLLKVKSGKLLTRWINFYVVLEDGILYHYINKAANKPHDTIFLFGCSIIVDDLDIRVMHQHQTVAHYRASSCDDVTRWVDALQWTVSGQSIQDLSCSIILASGSIFVVTFKLVGMARLSDVHVKKEGGTQVAVAVQQNSSQNCVWIVSFVDAVECNRFYEFIGNKIC